MYAIKEDNAIQILRQNNVIEKTEESHYLFGRNDVFSFEEDGSIYSVVERPGKDLLIHDFERMGETERKVSELDKDTATEFLKKTGHTPFMKFDITRYLIEEDGRKIVIENVEQLGYFVNISELGERKVNYGQELKDEMIQNTEKQRRIRQEAEQILQSV